MADEAAFELIEDEARAPVLALAGWTVDTIAPREGRATRLRGKTCSRRRADLARRPV